MPRSWFTSDRPSPSDLFLQSPYTSNPSLEALQNMLKGPQGGLAQELSALAGRGALGAIYSGGRVPHVQTSPGVYESGYRAKGFLDPRWDDVTIANLLGQQKPQKQKSKLNAFLDLIF